MNQFQKEDLFTIEEVAKWCNLSPRAAYMHYYRGHLEPVKEMRTHRLYFTRQAVDEFRALYIPFND